MLSNAYLLAQFGLDKAEKEPANFSKMLLILQNIYLLTPLP